MAKNRSGRMGRILSLSTPGLSWLLSILLLIAVVSAERGMAQTELGAVTGTIQDNTGAAIPNCQVDIRNLNTSAVRSTKTDQNGFYTIPSLTVGPYQITATASGFQRAVKPIELTTSGANGDLQLTVGNVQEQVTITASSGSVALQTDSHDVATSVSPVQLVNLPNNGRSILNIATLGPASQPGTDVGVDVGDEGFYNQTAASVIISGLGNAHAAFLQDGVDNTNHLNQTANILASVEATQEVSTLMNGAPARFSQPSVIDVITKGGSNKFHGTAYDFLQNDDFDATNWFATSKPAKRYNQFGANLGGPILKNKVFAFFDYSGLRSQTAAVNRVGVRAAAERTGDFSADGLTLYNPATYNPATGTD